MRKTILGCKEKGYGNGVVIFLVSQIGHDEGATKFLQELESDDDIRDMVFCSEKKLDDLKGLAQKNSTSDEDKKYTALVRMQLMTSF